jgi:hypothetical protein
MARAGTRTKRGRLLRPEAKPGIVRWPAAGSLALPGELPAGKSGAAFRHHAALETLCGGLRRVRFLQKLKVFSQVFFFCILLAFDVFFFEVFIRGHVSGIIFEVFFCFVDWLLERFVCHGVLLPLWAKLECHGHGVQSSKHTITLALRISSSSPLQRTVIFKRIAALVLRRIAAGTLLAGAIPGALHSINAIL